MTHLIDEQCHQLAVNVREGNNVTICIVDASVTDEAQCLRAS
ncbi:MAG TPA: hypothetical protein VIF32_11665 [Gemmatimonadaceae bacterium]